MHIADYIDKSTGELVFSTFTPNRKWYKGYLLEQSSCFIYVYDVSGPRQRCVWEEHVNWDGKNGWSACRDWINKQLQPKEHQDAAHQTD